MSLQVVEPRSRGFLSLSAHPEGCARMVEWQIERARRPLEERAGGGLLVLGASTGYGLASRIAGAFGQGMRTAGVFFERPAGDRRTASAGWYNAAALDRALAAEGLVSRNVNGDAFSDEVIERTLGMVERDIGPLDVVVYSLAAPRRTDPDTLTVYQSALKTIGEPFVTRTLDLDTGRIVDVSLESATPDEIDATVAVMGGAGLRRWAEALLDAGLLARGARLVAYSYIGPEVTWPVYRHGTIGRAKIDLERTCDELHGTIGERLGGSCRVVVAKSIVSQASAAIPAVPLYMSLLFAVMKDAGIHEGPIEQMVRLFGEHIGPGRVPVLDGDGRIRLDDLELRPDIQAEVARRWDVVDDARLDELADVAGYRRYFRQLFGFDVPGVDYSRAVETDVPLELV